MAAEPHWVGTEYGEENRQMDAEKQFKSWGYDAQNRNLPCIVSLPKSAIIGNDCTRLRTSAKLTAVPVEGDPYTAQGDKLIAKL